MLDFNLNMLSSLNYHQDRKITHDQEQPSSRIFQEDSSNTSTSSSVVVNSPSTSAWNSSAAAAATHPASFISFGIMKQDENSPSRECNSLTRQLFPVTGESESSRGREFSRIELGSSVPFTKADDDAGDKQWLNLSSHADSAEAGLRILQRNKHQPIKKSRRGPRSRSSQYRGVTFYRRTGRWESHIWDSGKQVYLGGFDTAYVAARAYDRAAVRFRGLDADINFDVSDYEQDIEKMKHLTKEEFVQILRRECTSLSRGSCKYKGLTLQKSIPLKAAFGQFRGKKTNDVAAIKSNDMRREEAIRFGGHTKGGDQNLELSLGISSSENKKSENGRFVFWL